MWCRCWELHSNLLFNRIQYCARCRSVRLICEKVSQHIWQSFLNSYLSVATWSWSSTASWLLFTSVVQRSSKLQQERIYRVLMIVSWLSGLPGAIASLFVSDHSPLAPLTCNPVSPPLINLNFVIFLVICGCVNIFSSFRVVCHVISTSRFLRSQQMVSAGPFDLKRTTNQRKCYCSSVGGFTILRLVGFGILTGLICVLGGAFAASNMNNSSNLMTDVNKAGIREGITTAAIIDALYPFLIFLCFGSRWPVLAWFTDRHKSFFASWRCCNRSCCKHHSPHRRTRVIRCRSRPNEISLKKVHPISSRGMSTVTIRAVSTVSLPARSCDGFQPPALTRKDQT